MCVCVCVCVWLGGWVVGWCGVCVCGRTVGRAGGLWLSLRRRHVAVLALAIAPGHLALRAEEAAVLAATTIPSHSLATAFGAARAPHLGLVGRVLSTTILLALLEECNSDQMPGVIVWVTTGFGGGMKGLPSEGQVPIGHDMPPPSRTIWAHTRRIAKSQRPTAEENGRAGKQPEPRRLCHGCRGQGRRSHLLDAPVLDSIIELGPC